MLLKATDSRQELIINETFALVARSNTIQTLCAPEAHKSWKIFQLDVKSAFLNGILDEEVYVDQSEGFIREEEGKVFRLKKTLYEFKQAPRAWLKK